MFVKEITYEDYAGNTRTETVRFQLTKAEIMELAYSVKGGFVAAAQKIINDGNEPEMFSNFKKIIAIAYGEVSDDNRRFVKSPELSKAFMETPMYDILFEELTTKEGALNNFIEQLVPKDAKADVTKALQDYATTGNINSIAAPLT